MSETIKIPKMMTLKFWNEKYPDAMGEIFSMAALAGITSLVVPPNVGDIHGDIMYQYLMMKHSERYILFDYCGDVTIDNATIEHIKSNIYLASVAKEHKYENLSDLLYQNWDLDKVKEILEDYHITKTGSYLENSHMYTDPEDTTGTSNKVINTRSNRQYDQNIYSYDGVQHPNSHDTTNYQVSTGQETTQSNKFDYYKDITHDGNNYKEHGSKGKSLVDEIPALLEFLNIDLIEEYLNDIMPSFMYYLY